MTIQDFRAEMPLPPKESVVRQLLLTQKILTEKRLSTMSTKDLEDYIFERYMMMPMRKTKKIKSVIRTNEYGEEQEYTEKITDDWLLIPIEKEEKFKELGFLVKGITFYG